MLHILHLLGELDEVGGTSRLLLSLVRNSEPTAIRHSFLCMRRGNLQKEFERAGALVEVVGSTSPLNIIHAALLFSRRHRVALLSTHFTTPLICGGIVGRWLNLPLIHNEHGTVSPEPARRRLRSALGASLKRQLLRRAGLVICNSNYTAAEAACINRLRSDRVRVLHLPVERRSERPGAEAANLHFGRDDEGGFWIGHVGGMIDARDQRTLIRAIHRLRMQGIDARLMLVGDGPRRAALEELTATLGLRSEIRFVGYQTNLSGFFRKISIYVNPAIAEGFGIAVVEAMLEEIPVVLANAGAHPELLEHERTGLLYKPGDESHLAESLLRLAQDPILRARLATAGREHAEQSFKPRDYARTYRELAELALTPASRRSHPFPTDGHFPSGNHESR